MWLIFISLFLLSFCVSGMEKIPYAMHHMHSESVVRPESMWLVVAANDKDVHLEGAKLDEFFATARARLVQDRCMLSSILHSGLTIILSVHCPLYEYDDNVEKDMKTLLLHTNALVLSTFGQDNYAIGPDTPNNAPAQWHGTYKSAGIISRGEHLNLPSYRVLTKERIQQIREAESFQIGGSVPWHLDRIDMRQGMLNHEYMYLNDGSNVDVYVLDGGILHTHEEFEGRATFLYSTVRDGVTSDCGSGHGTHVAGIIGSRTYGVAKKAMIYAVRVLDCDGGGTAKDIAEGVDAVLNRTLRSNRRSVINLSIGGDKNAAVDFQVKRLRAAGVVVVAASGNEGDNACDYSPSNLGKSNYVLTVGASDRYDNSPSWSNYGACVSLLAPGVSITSLGIKSNTAIATKDGSSMAAPSVSGAVALLLDQDATLSVERVNELIVSRATPVNDGVVLYTLINLREDVDPSSPPSPADVFVIPFNSAERQHISAGGVILCVSFTLLWFICMV